MLAYVDGSREDAERGTIPTHDRGFLPGDGVYDTCRVLEGRYFRFVEHALRLRASAAVPRIPVPDVDVLHDIALELLDRNDGAALEHAVLRITTTRVREACHDG